MKKFINFKTKAPLLAVLFVLIIATLGIYVSFSKAVFSTSYLKDTLRVIGLGEFGGGIVVGLDPTENGLIVNTGKVGIGTTSPASLLSVAGDVLVTGKIKAQGGYENPLTCPIFGDVVAAFGHKSFPGQTLRRYSGLVPNYGVVVDEVSAGDDERLFWSNCTVNPANRTITFSNPGVQDGGDVGTFTYGAHDEIMPVFRKAIGYSSITPTARLAQSSGYAFCQELGLVATGSLNFTSGSVRTAAFVSGNRWEMTPLTFTSYLTSVTCTLP